MPYARWTSVSTAGGSSCGLFALSGGLWVKFICCCALFEMMLLFAIWLFFQGWLLAWSMSTASPAARARWSMHADFKDRASSADHHQLQRLMSGRAQRPASLSITDWIPGGALLDYSLRRTIRWDW